MQRRAVVIFGRSPRAEAASKGVPQLERVFRGVAAAWTRAAARCGATAIIASAQRGTSFGERLANAAADAFAAGFDTILLTGIDTPPMGALEDAFVAVERGDVDAAIAPSTDGGINAIVLAPANASILVTFTPRDPQLAQRCVEHFAGRVFLLATGTDIDSAEALRFALREPLWRPFLGCARHWPRRRAAAPRRFVHAARSLRAPPGRA